MGTPYYMSPEQCQGRAVDHRTDIYSMGVVAFRTLTARYPFDGTYVELMSKHVAEEAPLASAKNPTLPASVDRGIAWMMQKHPAERPPSVLAGVKALLDEPLVTADALPAPRRRRWWWLALPAALAIAAVAAVVLVAERRDVAPAVVRAPDAAMPVVAPPASVDAAVAAPADASIAVDAAPRPDAAPTRPHPQPHPHTPAHDDLERPKF